MSSKLTQPDTLNLTTAQAADIGTFYLLGEVVGALVFGKFSDKLGRRKLFMWTLAVYLAGTARGCRECRAAARLPHNCWLVQKCRSRCGVTWSRQSGR